MANDLRNDAIDIPPAAAQRFSWRSELTLWFGMMLGCTAAQLAVGWYNGRGARPLMISGFLLYITSLMGIGVHRRWKAAKEARPLDRRWHLSMAESLMLFTGLTFFLGFTATDHRESQRVHRERDKFSALALPILGPDGRLSFESDGDISIIVCDRSFDDDRLAQLATLIRQHQPEAQIHSLMFGSSAKFANVPPRWPGVTDRSADLIMQWKSLEWLFIEGTAISPAELRKLLTLPALHEACREGLKQAFAQASATP